MAKAPKGPQAAKDTKDANDARPAEHRWAIDGIEEEMVRVEEDGERMLTVPRYLLPSDAREGQLLTVTRSTAAAGTVTLTIAVDEAATAAAVAESEKTVARAVAASKSRDPGGNVAL
jgi:hypothetical protein